MSAAQVEPGDLEWGEILLVELDRIFDSECDILELGLVPRADPCDFGAEVNLANTDGLLSHPEHGPAFALLDNNLGIAFWAVHPLCSYAMSVLPGLRASHREARNELVRLAAIGNPKSNELVSIVQRLESSAERVLSVTRTICLVNADNYTAWNMRKRVYEALVEMRGAAPMITSLLTELRLLDLIFTKHPKNGESWSHRRWVLQQITMTAPRLSEGRPIPSTPELLESQQSQLMHLSLHSARSLLFTAEWSTCDKTAEAYPRNYYSWNHRLWILKHLDSIPDILGRLELLQTAWNDRHMSDYSGMVCRQQMLRMILERTIAHQDLGIHVTSAQVFRSREAILRRDARENKDDEPPNRENCLGCRVIAGELDYVMGLFDMYGDHEALWMHRRFLWFCQWRLHLSHLDRIQGLSQFAAHEELLRLAESAYARPKVPDGPNAFIFGEGAVKFLRFQRRFQAVLARDALVWARDLPEAYAVSWQLRLELSIDSEVRAMAQMPPPRMPSLR